MRKTNVAVCDDDQAALGIISSSLKGCFVRRGINVDISLYGSADALEADLSAKAFDLLLLDIDMPGTDGITFANRLRDRKNPIDIIYISNREDKVFESLRSSPCGFIRKSRFLQDMAEIVDAYLASRGTKREMPSLVVQTRDSVASLPLDKIRFIEGNRKSQLVHVEGHPEPYGVRGPMQELEDELVPQGFIRIHKGYLVNYRFIRRIDDTDVVLDNGERVPLSRRKIPEVREQYLMLMQEQGALLF